MSPNTVSGANGASINSLQNSYGVGDDGLVCGSASTTKTPSPDMTVASIKSSSTEDNQCPAVQMGLAVPQFTPDDEILIHVMSMKLNEQCLNASKGRLQDGQRQLKTLADKRAADLQIRLKQIAASGTAQKVACVLGWIAAASMTTAGAILMAAGGAGTPLLVAGIASLATMTLQQTGLMDVCVNGIADALQKAGLSKEASQIVATVFMAAVIVAVSCWAGSAAVSQAGRIGGILLGLAVGSEAAPMLASADNLEKMGISRDAASTASFWVSVMAMVIAVAATGYSAVKGVQALKSLTAMGGVASDLVGDAAKATRAATQLNEAAARSLVKITMEIQCLTTAGGGAAGIANAFYGLSAGKASAQCKDDDAEIGLLVHFSDEEKNTVQEILDRIQQETTVVVDTLNNAYTTQKNTANW